MAFKTDEANTDLFQNSERNVQRVAEELVDEIVEAVDNLKAAEEVVSDLKGQFRELARDAYWEGNFQVVAPVHTFDASGKSNTVQVNFLNKYDLDKEKAMRVAQLLGKGVKLLARLKEKTIVNVDVSALPKDQMVEFFKATSALCKEYGLQGYVDDKYAVEPEFHDERHVLMPDINQAIDEILPVQVHITT